MQHRTLRHAALLSVMTVSAIGFSAIGFAPAARAQVGPMDPSSMMQHRASTVQDDAAPKVVQPPALPGAASRADTVAPASRIPTDMSPNDALFDAINRGDVVAARDALSRGADLRAQNLLGMTPMELSVDLGRNDISFVLLSYRGGDSGRDAPAGTKAEAAAPAKVTKVVATKGAAREPVVPVSAAVPQPAPARTPKLFANDGGAPVPNAGFLGFDSGRSN